jgi:hypothetical protein
MNIKPPTLYYILYHNPFRCICICITTAGTLSVPTRNDFEAKDVLDKQQDIFGKVSAYSKSSTISRQQNITRESGNKNPSPVRKTPSVKPHS